MNGLNGHTGIMYKGGNTIILCVRPLNNILMYSRVSCIVACGAIKIYVTVLDLYNCA